MRIVHQGGMAAAMEREVVDSENREEEVSSELLD